VLFGCTTLLAACGDQPTAPSVSRGANAPVPPAQHADVYVDSLTTGDDSSFADIRVTPSGGWFHLGNSAVFFPANAICDPATSTYGPAEWDQPCTAATEEVHIHAQIDRGRQWIDFTPALRFVPSDDPSRWVYLYVYSPVLDSPSASMLSTDAFRMLYVATPTSAGVDESLGDATLATHTLPEQAMVYRRVKHFSGYQVIVGVAPVDSSSVGVGSEEP
jgi:hypothetical protein